MFAPDPRQPPGAVSGLPPYAAIQLPQAPRVTAADLKRLSSAPQTPPLSAIDASPSAPKLPAAPPRSRPGLWDEGNRHKTLLAIAAGFGSSLNFGDGLSRAAGNVLGLSDRIDADARQQHEYGGPDDVFDIATDPATGNRTVRAVPEFVAYKQRQQPKPKDTADLNGRAMYALQQLPPEERAAAYVRMREHPAFYGIDAATMPDSYDPTHAAVTAGMGMTVPQALRARQQEERDEALRAAREAADKDRAKRTSIMAGRAATAAAQGNVRLAQGAQRIAISKAKGSGKASGADPRYDYKVLPNGQVARRLKR